MRTQVVLLGMVFSFLSEYNAHGQTSFDSCIVYRGERHILFNNACHMSAADIIKDLPSYISEEGKVTVPVRFAASSRATSRGTLLKGRGFYMWRVRARMSIFGSESVKPEGMRAPRGFYPQSQTAAIPCRSSDPAEHLIGRG